MVHEFPQARASAVALALARAAIFEKVYADKATFVGAVLTCPGFDRTAFELGGREPTRRRQSHSTPRPLKGRRHRLRSL